MSETEASSTAGSMTFKWKYPSSVTSVVTPKTAPLALKAPSVPYVSMAPAMATLDMSPVDTLDMQHAAYLNCLVGPVSLQSR